MVHVTERQGWLRRTRWSRAPRRRARQRVAARRGRTPTAMRTFSSNAGMPLGRARATSRTVPSFATTTLTIAMPCMPSSAASWGMPSARAAHDRAWRAWCGCRERAADHRCRARTTARCRHRGAALPSLRRRYHGACTLRAQVFAARTFAGPAARRARMHDGLLRLFDFLFALLVVADVARHLGRHRGSRAGQHRSRMRDVRRGSVVLAGLAVENALARRTLSGPAHAAAAIALGLAPARGQRLRSEHRARRRGRRGEEDTRARVGGCGHATLLARTLPTGEKGKLHRVRGGAAVVPRRTIWRGLQSLYLIAIVAAPYFTRQREALVAIGEIERSGRRLIRAAAARTIHVGAWYGLASAGPWRLRGEQVRRDRLVPSDRRIPSRAVKDRRPRRARPPKPWVRQAPLWSPWCFPRATHRRRAREHVRPRTPAVTLVC